MKGSEGNRKWITMALCLLIALSCLLPYIGYQTPDVGAEEMAAMVDAAQVQYEADVVAYHDALRSIEAAQGEIDRVQPEYDRVKAELAAAEADADTTALKEQFDAMDAQLVAARKITSTANTVAMPVPAQTPVPAAADQTARTQQITGLQLMGGAMSAANHTKATWTLIAGLILLLAAAVVCALPLNALWRKGLAMAGSLSMIFSALRLDTATARELGAIAKVYQFELGYTLAVVGALVAIIWAAFEQKQIDLSWAKVKTFLSEKAIYLVLLALIAIIGIIKPKFFSTATLLNIVQQSSTRLIIAMGMSFVIIGTGGVDLSACRVVGMTAVISASMLQTSTYSRLFFPSLPWLPVILPFVIAVIVAFVFGMMNGVIVAKLGVPPFITTLATQVIIYGATSIYFNMEPNSSQPIGGLREDFTWLGSGSVYGFIPIVVIIALVVCLVVWFVQKKTVFGKNVFAIGGNREAAKVSGINVSMTIIAIFALAATLIGMAGVLEAARTGGATNNYGVGYELDAIAACVVGGVSSSGGVGTIGGIVSGVFIFQVINYGLTFLGVNPYWQQIIKGIIIATAVALDIRKYMTKK